MKSVISEVKKLNKLMQVATDNEQPITFNMTLGVFNSIMEYRIQQAIDAYKEQEKRIAKENDNGDLLTTKQAKAMFPHGLSDATLWRWCKQGLLNKKNVGGKVFYSRIEIENLLKEV